jgi:hypothetical protein
MLLPWSIILDAAGPVKGAWRAPVLWTTLTLVAVLLIAAVVLAVVDRWRKRSAMTERMSPGEQLTHFRELYDRGELSREEFERIRALLGQRLRQDLQLPGGMPASAPAPNHKPEPDNGIRPADGQGAAPPAGSEGEQSPPPGGPPDAGPPTA